MAGAEGAGAGGEAGREPTRGGCGEVCADSRLLRASRGELPGEPGHGVRRRGGDGMKRKPRTPKKAPPSPAPALLCAWRVPDDGASNRSSARVWATPGGAHSAPGALGWGGVGARGGGPRWSWAPC